MQVLQSGRPSPKAICAVRASGYQAYWTDSRNVCHLAQRRSSLIGCVSRLPAMDFIAGCATSLPLRPLRSPDQNDNLFENRSRANDRVVKQIKVVTCGEGGEGRRKARGWV